MIICFTCNSETKRALDRLLESGQYKDYSEIVAVAIGNLEAMQAEVQKTGAIIIDSELNHDDRVNLPDGKSNESTLVRAKKDNHLKIASDGTDDKASGIPSLFRLDADAPSSFAKLPSDVWVRGQEVPLDRWLFGQYNKLLPTKVNCRGLAHLLMNEPKGIALQKAGSQITQNAAVLGSFLKTIDERYEIPRDDALSTAFPLLAENAEKSRLRYTGQFIGNINKHGQLSGLLIDLKLINHTGGSSPRLLLTEFGWDFAKLENPILDGKPDGSTQKFNEVEIEFLLKHIADHVPAESFAYRTILRAVLDGVDTPDKIDKYLHRFIHDDGERKLSEAFLSSQRSGAISRLADLGLVGRIRNGVRVSYLVTETGKQYLNKLFSLEEVHQ